MSMETMWVEAVVDGQPPLHSAEVVSKVLFQNAGIATPSSKSPSAGEEAIHEELATERQGSAVLHQEFKELKKKSE
jgi:hypothetical protein